MSAFFLGENMCSPSDVAAFLLKFPEASCHVCHETAQQSLEIPFTSHLEYSDILLAYSAEEIIDTGETLNFFCRYCILELPEFFPPVWVAYANKP